MTTETHAVLPGSYRPPSRTARRIRDLDPHAHVEVTVTIRAPDLPSADAMPAKALSPQQFAKQYGANPADVQTVANVLRGFGLSIDQVTQAGRSIHVSGTAAAMQAAFRADLGVYHGVGMHEFRGRQGDLQVPAPLSQIITGVHGLDQRQVAHRKERKSGHKAKVPAKKKAALNPQTPADLQAHYNFPPGTGKGQTVAIAEFGVPVTGTTFLPPVYLPDDVDAFQTKYGLLKADVQIVPVNLTPLKLSDLQQLPQSYQKTAFDLAVEVMMDVEIVASLCPEARIQVYFASFDQKGWVDLLDAVSNDTTGLPVTLSLSWGLAEDAPDWSASALAAINQRLQIAAMHGITVCVASGDDGSGDQMDDKNAHVDFPAASPFVLGVGGTQLVATAANVIDEVVWWETPGRRANGTGGSTGGGVSMKFPRPKWQDVTVKSLNAAAIDGRVVPDVAALAGEPLYDLIFDGEDFPNGGTSAAAPLWAALLARVNAQLPAAKQQRFLTPLLYGKSAGNQTLGALSCRDVATGNNVSKPSPGVGYDAGIGYDAVSGWGVPDGNALLANLKKV